MMVTCPNGHASSASDYCDVCGAPIPAGRQDPAVAAESLAAGRPTPTDTGGFQPAAQSPGSVNAAIKSCPNCGAANPGAALFCEACGYDFTTGSLPRGSVRVPAPLYDPFDLDAPAAPAPSRAVPFDLDAPAPVAPEPAPPVPPAATVQPGPPTPSVQPTPPAVAPGPAAPLALPAPPVLPRLGGATAVRDVPAPAVPAPAAVPVPAPAAVPAPAEVPPPTAAAEWVAEVWIDPDWYAGQSSPDQLPSPGLPRVVGLRNRASLVGRPSRSRGISPDVDCEPDTGVSRRHAELSTDGTRWWVEDLGSANGTFVGEAGAPLPTEPIRAKTEVGEDFRVYVGSWTRLVVRRANPDEAGL